LAHGPRSAVRVAGAPGRERLGPGRAIGVAVAVAVPDRSADWVLGRRVVGRGQIGRHPQGRHPFRWRGGTRRPRRTRTANPARVCLRKTTGRGDGGRYGLSFCAHEDLQAAYTSICLLLGHERGDRADGADLWVVGAREKGERVRTIRRKVQVLPKCCRRLRSEHGAGGSSPPAVRIGLNRTASHSTAPPPSCPKRACLVQPVTFTREGFQSAVMRPARDRCALLAETQSPA
jgi:hypothetical protein